MASARYWFVATAAVAAVVYAHPPPPTFSEQHLARRHNDDPAAAYIALSLFLMCPVIAALALLAACQPGRPYTLAPH